MAWTNQDLVLYHGTDDASASAIVAGGVKLGLCSPLTDFGRGFYTTTNAAQAVTWAHHRTLRVQATRNPTAKPAVIQLSADRSWLGTLDSLVFPRAARVTGFPDFVRYCRRGHGFHRASSSSNYQVVYGPVAQWQGLFDPNLELFVLSDCDQVSFHEQSHLTVGGPLLGGAKVTALPPLGSP